MSPLSRLDQSVQPVAMLQLNQASRNSISDISTSYSCSPFFLLKARFIVENVRLRGSSGASAFIPPGKAAGRTELKMALTLFLKMFFFFPPAKQSPPSASELMLSCQNVFPLNLGTISITVVYRRATSQSSSVAVVLMQ